MIGDILDIAHVIKRAYNLYEGCAAAPDEIRFASEHVHAMALCLAGVESDIMNNPRSFVHQNTDVAKARTHSLKKYVGTCEQALQRMGNLLATYRGFKSKHVSMWDRFRWSTKGKKEIADCKSDIIAATMVLDMFLKGLGINILGKVEGMMESFNTRMDMMERLLIAALNSGHVPTAVAGQKRPRAGSNVATTIAVSLVLGRLRKILLTYRRKKIGGAAAGGHKKPHPGGPRRPKAATRTNSGFGMSAKRSQLAQSYAANIADLKPPPYTSRPSSRRPRTPSPDFHYIPGGSSIDTSPLPGPIRRSSSMNRLLGQLNAKIVTPRQPNATYACWRVGVGNTAVGLKTSPEFKPYKRGQAQLRKMGEAFKEASAFDGRALTEDHKGVKMLLKARNNEEKGKRVGRKWYFVGGRTVGRDPGRTGLVSVDKAFVVLVRR